MRPGISGIGLAWLAGFAITACGEGPLEVRAAAQLTERIETDHYRLHFSPGDGVQPTLLEQFYDRMAADLGVTLPGTLLYFKYRDRDHMDELIGRRTNGFAEPEALAVHSIFGFDGHEVVHVFSAQTGRPSDSFNEGLAVALNSDPSVGRRTPLWGGRHVHAHVRILRQTGQYVPVTTILERRPFRDVDEFVAYGEMGSFVLFLIDEFGFDPLLDFIRRSTRDDSDAAIAGNVQAAWGAAVNTLVTAWLAVVDEW